MPTEDEALSNLDTPEAIKARDEYVARQIDKTLKDEETGLLFMGLKHDVDKVLKKYPDIDCEVVFGKNEWPERVLKVVELNSRTSEFDLF